MKPLILQGSPSFSPFRIASLSEKIKQAAPDLKIASITARDVFFLETKGKPDADTRQKANALLGAEQ